MGSHWRNLPNAIEPSVCGSDAAFLSNYFDDLLLSWRRYERERRRERDSSQDVVGGLVRVDTVARFTQRTARSGSQDQSVNSLPSARQSSLVMTTLAAAKQLRSGPEAVERKNNRRGIPGRCCRQWVFPLTFVVLADRAFTGELCADGERGRADALPPRGGRYRY